MSGTRLERIVNRFLIGSKGMGREKEGGRRNKRGGL